MADPFRFADQSTAHDTQQLLAILEEKDTGLTQPHVARNDYANWVRYSLENDTLADRLEKCRSVQQVIDVLRLEHTPRPSEPEKQPAAAKQASTHDEQSSQQPREPVREQQVHEKREPIRDLHKASPSPHHTAPIPPEEHRADPSPAPRETPKKPEPVPKQGLLERYNAREFLMGFLAGIVVTVLVYGIIGTLG